MKAFELRTGLMAHQRKIEEVFRLKQLVGIPDMFQTAGFGQAWKPEKTF